jgi:DNA-binding NarL/FixJ family response regulator
VDDDAAARLCLEDILRETDDFSCAGCFSNAAEALVDIPRLNPDLVLMDINLPGLNGIECTKRLKHISPHLHIIMVSGLHDVTSIELSLKAGAAAYLVKPVTPDQCLATLKCTVANTAGREQKQESGQRTSLGNGSALTPRENEILERLAEGLIYKEIADKLKISYSAVHKLQHRIFVKLDAGNRTEAIAKWRDGNRAQKDFGADEQ